MVQSFQFMPGESRQNKYIYIHTQFQRLNSKSESNEIQEKLTSAVEEAGVSRHNGDPIRGPP